MADTLPPITGIADEWINVYSAIDISVGTPLTVQNTGTMTLLLFVSELQPASTAQGRHIYPLDIETLNVGNSGLWVKSSPKGVGLSRLQVDIVGGIDETRAGANIFPDSLQLQIARIILAAGDSRFIQFTNNTNASILLEQIVNAEAIPTGATEGTSSIALSFFFNPDFTGATQSPAESKAYANGYDGLFVDITGGGVLLNVIDNFNLAINQDVLRIIGGQTTYSVSQQALIAASVNQQLTLVRAFAVASKQSIVMEIENTGIIDGGTEVGVTGLISGRFLTTSSRVEVLPEDLTYEGDFLTYDGDQLTYGE